MGFVIVLLSCIAILFLTILGIQNGNTLTDVALFTRIFKDVPLTLVMIESFAAGIIVAVIIAGLNELRIRQKLWEIEKRNKELTDEIKALRNVPLNEIKKEGGNK
uniref:LapA family protein n=1 Tax=candidate division WOR-3 bacterium TaxID=2052148 RepID=A0A7C4YEW9_UNCW3